MSLGRTLESWLIGWFNRNKPSPARKYVPPPPRPKPPAPEPPPIPEGFLIGTEDRYYSRDEPRVPVVVDPADRGKPNYVVGGNGGGKTNTLFRMIDWEVECGSTVVFIDLRGDAIERILVRLLGAGVAAERVALIDLAREDVVAPMNFLANGAGEPYRRALPVLEAIRTAAGGLSAVTEEGMRSVLVALAEAGGSLVDIEPMLTNPAFRANILTKVRDPYTLGYFERFELLGREKQLASTLPITNKLAPFIAAPIVRRMLGTSRAIDLAQILNRRERVLLISLAVDRHHEVSQLVGSLLIGAIERTILGRLDVPEADRVPTRVFLDEFANFRGQAFDSIIAEGRRFGLGTTIAHQNQSQLDTKTREHIRNNSALRVLFNAGPIDSIELAPELATMSRDAARTALMNLRPGEAFVIRAGKPAVKVLTPLSPDPPVDPEALARFREAALKRYGIPREEVDQELAARHGAATGGAVTSARSEVRHEQLPEVDDDAA